MKDRLMPVTRTLSAEEAHVTSVIEHAAAAGDRVVLTRDGKPWVAIVPVEDVAWLETQEDGREAEAFREARAEWQRAGGKTRALEDIARELGVDA